MRAEFRAGAVPATPAVSPARRFRYNRTFPWEGDARKRGSRLTREGGILELFSSWQLIGIAVLIGLAGGFLRGISGFGAALAMVPLLALVVPTQIAVVTVVLTTLLTNVPMSYATRHEADWNTVAWISAGAAVGLLPGLWLLAHLPSDTLRRMVGIVVLGSAALLAFAQPRKDALTPPFRLAAGVASGVLNGAVSLGGPPVVLYFLWTTATAQTSRASFVAYFTVLQLAQLAMLLLAGLVAPANIAWTAIVAPAMMAGTYAGSWVFRIGGHRHFRLIALGLLAVTGLATVIR